jgi:hypothetical protein
MKRVSSAAGGTGNALNNTLVFWSQGRSRALFAVFTLACARAEAASPAAEPARADCLPAVAVDDAGLPGVVDPFHVPSDEAKRLNADALIAYRQGRWDEARRQYRAAETADPAFLAPALNVACSFVRQERLADALGEVRRLLARAYLPWSDEILTAADLGALKVGPAAKQLHAVLDEERRRWTEGLARDLLFVARTRVPLKVAVGSDGQSSTPRTLVLGPRQEVFAWSPRTSRYRQLTAERGRVLVLAAARDGLRIAYVTAEKLVVTPGAPPALRGAVVKELSLATLTVLAEARVPEDVRSLEILQTPAGFAYRLNQPSGRRSSGVALAGGRVVQDGLLVPAAVASRQAIPVVTLTGEGVAPAARATALPDDCDGVARDARSSAGTQVVEVIAGRTSKSAKARARAEPARAISGPFGGGLHGLPIP